MKLLEKNIFLSSGTLCLIVGLTLVNGAYVQAQTSTDIEILATIDGILAGVPAGQDVATAGDMQFSVSNLENYRQEINSTVTPRGATNKFFTKWPNGVVPYVFDASVATANQQKFLNACRKWLNTANLTFVERTSSNASTYPNYIRVVSSTVNNSFVGMQGGQQVINIVDWDSFFGFSESTICHELGHALGMVHEHQRSDRNTYVIVNDGQNGHPNNITNGNFTQMGILDDTRNYTSYDYASVMHYDRFAFSKNGQPTIVPLDPNAVIGNPSGISISDKETMKQIYGTSPDTTAPTVTITSPTNGQKVNQLTTINGQVTDTGSGVHRVEIALSRDSDGRYWNGSSWETLQDSSPKLSTTLSGSTWTCNSTLPSFDQGIYTVYAFAYDNRENTNTVAPQSTVTVDKTAPAVTITVPTNNIYVSALPAVTGTASDTGGSALNQVRIQLKRVIDSKYWNSTSSTWVAATAGQEPFLTATISGTTWTRATTGFPTSTNLNEGVYEVIAVGVDGAGNVTSVPVTGSNKVTVTVDKTPPTVSVDQPDPNEVLKNFNAGIRAGATDALSKPEKVRISVFRTRSGGTEYWNKPTEGSTGSWTTSAATAYVDVFSGSGGVWPASGSWPTPGWWAPIIATDGSEDGAYVVQAKSFDRAGNICAAPASIVVTIDNVKPAVSITLPGTYTTRSSFAQYGIRGIATDQYGLDRVEVYLFRGTAGAYQYWKEPVVTGGVVTTAGQWGTAGGTPTSINASGNGATTFNWIVSKIGTTINRLPVTTTDLPDGVYYIQVKAYDQVQNVTITTTRAVTIENVLPTVAFTNPDPAQPSTTRSTIGPLSGTAQDNAGGVGLDYVGVQIFRRVGTGTPVVYEYWNGDTSSWESNAMINLTPPTPNGTYYWSVPSNKLPLGANLPDGDYYVRARAYDRAGNVAVTNAELIIIDSGSSLLAGGSSGDNLVLDSSDDLNATDSSTEVMDTVETDEDEIGPIVLESGAAYASSSSMTLEWSGPLDSNWACDLSSYAVWVNGVEVLPVGAEYDTITYKLTLFLPVSYLVAGDQVAVSWNDVNAASGQNVVDSNWYGIAD